MREFLVACTAIASVDRDMVPEVEEGRWRLLRDDPLWFFHDKATETERKDIWRAASEFMEKKE